MKYSKYKDMKRKEWIKEIQEDMDNGKQIVVRKTTAWDEMFFFFRGIWERVYSYFLVDEEE